jgi:hypothetical protein
VSCKTYISVIIFSTHCYNVVLIWHRWGKEKDGEKKKMEKRKRWRKENDGEKKMTEKKKKRTHCICHDLDNRHALENSDRLCNIAVIDH